jgi:hypothetical protein
LTLVGLLTPVSVGFGSKLEVARIVPLSFLPFVALVIASLLFREAIRRYTSVRGTEKRRYARFAAVEAGVVLLATLGLVHLQGRMWALAILAVPAVVTELRYRRQGGSVPIWHVISGVLGLSLIVPLGLFTVGVTDRSALTIVFSLFVAYHVLAIVRVKMVMNRPPEQSGRSPGHWLLVPVMVLVATIAVWAWGVVGPSVPLLFLVSTMRTAHLASVTDLPSTKRLGRTEALLSILFVLGGPWFLP